MMRDDPVERVIAERIVLNAREAGLRLQLATGAGHPDLRLVRVPIASPEPHVALRELASALGFPSRSSAPVPLTICTWLRVRCCNRSE